METPETTCIEVTKDEALTLSVWSDAFRCAPDTPCSRLQYKIEEAVEALTPPPPVVLTLSADDAELLDQILRYDTKWLERDYNESKRASLARRVRAARRGGVA